MDRDELAKFLDEILDERQLTQSQSAPIFPRRDCVPKNLIPKNEKRKQEFLEKYYKPQPQPRKLRESPPGSGNYE